MEHFGLSKIKLKTISKLKQKKYRLMEGQVVVEGIRTLSQIKDYGIIPLEQYRLDSVSSIWDDVPTFTLQEWEMRKICSSENPQTVAALFSVPRARSVEFRSAFYLDGIGDPGNLGTIFRLAAAFLIDCIFLSPQCVEVSSPKVIRASLGSVYQVPFEIMTHSSLNATQALMVITDSHKGIPLKDFHPVLDERIIVVLGSEAHGIAKELRSATAKKIHIQTSSQIESLNVSVAAGIIAHHLYTG